MDLYFIRFYFYAILFLTYLDYWYEYEPVRHCTEDRAFCDSIYLFCDRSQWRCRSRVQLGGNCTGFMGTDICYKSICIQVIYFSRFLFCRKLFLFKLTCVKNDKKIGEIMNVVVDLNCFILKRV